MLRQIWQFDLIVLLHKRGDGRETEGEWDKSFVLSPIGGEKTEPYRRHKLIHAFTYSPASLHSGSAHSHKCRENITDLKLNTRGDGAFAAMPP